VNTQGFEPFHRLVLLQHFAEAEYTTQIARRIADHEWRESMGLFDCHPFQITAMLLEQIDKPERRGIVLFAYLICSLLAHLLRQKTARRRHGHDPLP